MNAGCKKRKKRDTASWPTDALSRVCRFLARTTELYEKGEAPRTTAVGSLSRPQKREQVNKPQYLLYSMICNQAYLAIRHTTADDDLLS